MTSTSRQRQEANRMKKKMSKEQLHLALTRKRECDARALTIVEKLIETEVDKNWLLENLEFINQCHMEDVVEERAILKRCGYALCDNVLKLNINQKYHISTKSNKVYDVSRRKNFCSNNCYGAGNYLLEQMLTSPLWLRDPKEKPQFQLLPRSGLAQKFTPGDEVDLGIENINVDVNKPSEITENQISDESLAAGDSEIQNSMTDRSCITKIKDEPDTLKEKAIAEKIKATVAEKVVEKQQSANDLVIEREVRLEKSEVPKETKRRTKRGKAELMEEKFDPNWLVERIERYLKEWITLDSLVLLLGDTVLKQQKIEEVTEGLKNEEVNKKYVQLCQKVNSFQIEEDSDEEEPKTDLRPLPDYQLLKQEGEKLEIKVKAFFEGSTIIGIPPTKLDDSSTKETEDSPAYLPTLSERDPRTLRRRIVLEKLDKVLPEMLRTLAGGDFLVHECIGSNGCGKTVKALVNTFSLSAKNVIPKPAEWNLLGLVFIKLLSISEPRLRFLLGTERATKYITMILMSYNLEPNYLDSLVAVVTDIESYNREKDLQKNIKAEDTS